MKKTDPMHRSIISTMLVAAVIALAGLFMVGLSPAQSAYAAPGLSFKASSTFVVDGNTYKITERYKSAADPGEVVLTKYASDKTTANINMVTYKGKKYEVEAIGKNAFNNAKGHKVVSVTLGRNVESIQARAFYGCSKLKTINIAKSDIIEVDYSRKTKCYYLDDVEIGAQAFAKAGVKNVKVNCGNANAKYQKVVKNALVKKGLRSTAVVVK